VLEQVRVWRIMLNHSKTVIFLLCMHFLMIIILIVLLCFNIVHYSSMFQYFFIDLLWSQLTLVKILYTMYAKKNSYLWEVIHALKIIQTCIWSNFAIHMSTYLCNTKLIVYKYQTIYSISPQRVIYKQCIFWVAS